MKNLSGIGTVGLLLDVIEVDDSANEVVRVQTARSENPLRELTAARQRGSTQRNGD